MKHGRLKAILWHQGESDLGKTNAGDYAGNSAGSSPISGPISTRPAPPLSSAKSAVFYGRKDGGGIDAFNKNLQAVAAQEKNCACVSSEGLRSRPDNLHFDAKSARELGRRYVAAYMKLAQNQPAAE